MSLTPAQERAISARGNVLVVAGAGTGKTRTLVERCLSCLLEENPPVSLDRILMVTFTEAAAAEMRQRIRVGLEEALKHDPSDLRRHEQLALFDTAHIGTLHSFCLQLIRPHFYELEIDPQLSVMAEEEARLLAEETLTSVLVGHYAGRASGARGVQQLIQAQGSGSDQPIRTLVLRVHHYSQTLPDPAGWFQDQIGMFASNDPARWQEWLLNAFAEWREDSLPLLKRCAEDSRNSEIVGHPLGAAGRNVRSRAIHNAIAERCAAALNAVPPGASRATIAVLLEQILAICDECPLRRRKQWLKDLEEFQAEAQFLLSLAALEGKTDPLAEDWEWVRGQMKALLELAREFGEAFTENKRELGMLDFHDLEQYALRLLWDNRNHQPTAIAREWRKKLQFIFVDEYQDINTAQDRIIETLSGQGADSNRFLVGDVKQSIYRFRLANPYIFLNYARTWGKGLGQTVPLVDNFRSCESILNFINSVFARVMHPQTGGVRYDDQAQLRFGAPADRRPLSAAANTGARVELHLRVKNAEEPYTDEPIDGLAANVLELEEAAKEARVVALRLRELKARQHPVWEQATQRFRPVEWRDIAILLRSPANKAESYAKEFSRLNVPLLVQRSGFYESIEISDLLSLFQVLDNPLQDLPVLAVLHSPLAGLTVNELATIRLAAKGQFWTALVLWHDSEKRKQGRGSKVEGEILEPQRAASDTFRKVSTFLDRFTRWRRLARQTSLSRCLEVVLAETHYDNWLLTQPRGEQRHANVQLLRRLVQQFDNFQRQGLFRFLCFVDAQKRAETEPEVRAASEENAIRLMSIHQSKGLEFPVVVVADLGKPFNLVDLRAGVILDEEYGLCPQIKPPHTGKRYPSLPYWLARRRQKRELLGEEMRLLYVAMTRARDTLLLSASVSGKKLEKLWLGKATPPAITSAGSLSDWLGLWFAENCASASATTGENSLLRWIIHDETRLLESIEERWDESPEPSVDPSPEALLRLQQRLSWQYPFLPATRTQAKASVTALRRRAVAQMDEDTFQMQHPRGGMLNASLARSTGRVPSRKTGALRSAAEIGSAHHAFLQSVSLECAGSMSAIKKEAERLQQERALTAEQVALLDLDALAAFWNSEIGQKIRAQAKFVKRELAFTARFSAPALGELLGEPPETTLQREFVVVQGVADLVVVMPRALWLLDFKTDVVKRDELPTKVQLYEPQMKLYARALSGIYSRPVTDCWLYFLDCRTAVRLRI